MTRSAAIETIKNEIKVMPIRSIQRMAEGIIGKDEPMAKVKAKDIEMETALSIVAFELYKIALMTTHKN